MVNINWKKYFWWRVHTFVGIPIALCCISPILAAKAFGSIGVEVTLGKKGDESKWPYGGALDAAQSFGAKVVEMNVDEVSLMQKIISSLIKSALR